MVDNRMLQVIVSSINALREDMYKRFDKVEREIKKNGERLSKLGASLAYLEDDTPTTEEFNKFEKRVTKLEKQAISS